MTKKTGRVLAVASVAGWMAAAVVFTAGPADADTGTEYGENNWQAICLTLDEHPTVGGVIGVAQAIVADGPMSFYQAGEALGWAVYLHCPRHAATLDRFGAAVEPAVVAR